MQVKANTANPFGKVIYTQHLTYCDCLGTAGNLSPAPGDQLRIRSLSSQRKCQDQACIKCLMLLFLHKMISIFNIVSEIVQSIIELPFKL